MLAKRVCASLAAFMIAAGAIIVPLGEGFHSAILPQPMIVEAVQSTKQQITKADIVFVVDSTGSMSRYIKSVKSNLTDFVNALNQRGVELNLSVVEFKDIEVSGNESTVYHTFDGSHWTSDTTKVIDVLDSISHNLGGGGDDPETPLESFDKLFTSDDSKWYEDDNDKFIFLLTDAGYKESSSHTFDEWADIISGYGIKTTVVSRNSYEGTYRNLYENTGGQFLNIDSNDYSSLMLDYADWVEDNLNPLAINVYGDYTAIFDAFQNKYQPIDISTYIKNIGNTAANNAYLRIELPDEMELADMSEGVDVEFFDNLGVEQSESRTWHINILNSIETGKTYPITIICGADDIEEKRIIREITVPEHETDGDTVDNRIDWGQELKDFWGNGTDTYPGIDNLKFTNSSTNIANYKISNENLRNLTINANMKSTVYNYIKQSADSDDWGGSCYGMSAVVSLAKTGLIHPELWRNDGDSGKNITHDIEIPKNDDYSQNLINYYHLMQFLPDIADIKDNYIEQFMAGEWSEANDSNVLKDLINNANNVKHGGYPVLSGFHYLKYKNINTNDVRIQDDEGNDVNNVKIDDYSNYDVVKSLLTEDCWYNDTYGKALSFSRDEFSKVGNDIYVDGKYLSEITDKDTIWLTDEKGTVGSCYKRAKPAGHAVIAYDVDKVNKTVDFNGKTKTFTYQVSICDPNYLNHWTYLYVCDDYSEWYYEDMKVNGDSKEGNLCIGTDGTPYQVMTYVLSDISTLDVVNIETHESRAVLHNYNRNFIKSYNSSVGSISTFDGRKSNIGILNGDGNLPLTVRYDIGETVEGDTNQNSTITLPEGNEESYTIAPKNNVLDSSINYTNYMFGVYAEAANNAKYNPNGSVEVSINDSDYTLEATFNDGYGDLPWFTLSANGSNANEASLSIEDHGMILSSDNLNDISITANNVYDTVSLTFSTDKTSVLLDDIDEDTLGVYIDTDNNGTYETIIADSDNTDYSKPNDDNSSSNDDSSSSNSSETDKPSSNDSSSSDNNSSSDTPSNSNIGSATSQNNTSTNTTTNPDSINNPKTGDVGTANKAFGFAALMLGVVTVLKKKKQ